MEDTAVWSCSWGQEAVLCVFIPPTRRLRKSQLAPLPGAANRSARRAEALQRRRKRAPTESLRAPHFGESCSSSRIPRLGLPLHSSRVEPAGCPQRRIPTRVSCRFWHPLRCGAGKLYRAGRTCKTHCERSIRIEAALPVAALVPPQRRPGRLQGAGYPAQLAYFTS